jgi:isoleucyl-tRNA synthetase
VNVVIALLTAVRTFPLLPEALQVVGLGYSAWFVVRKLLWAEHRREVLRQWESLKTTILGSGLADTLFNYYPSSAGDGAQTPRESTIEEPPVAPVPEPQAPQSPRPTDRNAVDELRYLFLASEVEIVDSAEDLAALPHKVVTEDLSVGMAKAAGCKCDRCWNYSVYVGQFSNYPDLCERCVPLIDR